MWKRIPLLLIALGANGALADGDALVIGNAQYGETRGAFGPDAVLAVTDALERRALVVESLANGTTDAMRDAFDAFVAGLDEETAPAIAVLGGAFAHDDTGTRLLPAGRAPDAKATGLSLDEVLGALAATPRRAFLVLGPDEPGAELGAGLTPGLGPLQLPDGVTVIRGAAGAVADFAANEMAQPGRGLDRLSGDSGLTVDGFTAPGLAVLQQDEVRPPTEAEQAAAAARRATQDDAAWQRAMEANTLYAYQAYIDSHPDGQHAAAARQRVNALQDAPDDTPDQAPAAGAQPEPDPLDAAARRAIQRDLSRLGFNTGGIDGVFGPVTRSAILAWQSREGFAETGALDTAQIARLAEQAAARPDPAPQPQPVPPRTAQPSANEGAVWSRVVTEGDLRAFLSRFPNGRFAPQARRMLAEIEALRQQVTGRPVQ